MSPPAEYIAAAVAANRKWGLAAAASVALAQCAQESNYGAHVPPGSNNPLGIKARLNPHGVPIEPYVVANSGEGGTAGHPDFFKHSPFRKYASVAEALDAHGRLLAQGSPYAGARKLLPNVDQFTLEMGRHYAGATDYGPLLIAKMHAGNLYQYDVRPA